MRRLQSTELLLHPAGMPIASAVVVPDDKIASFSLLTPPRNGGDVIQIKFFFA